MNYHVYFPNNLVRVLKTKGDLVLGFKIGNAFVCVSVVPLLNKDQLLRIRQKQGIYVIATKTGDGKDEGDEGDGIDERETEFGWFKVGYGNDKVPEIKCLSSKSKKQAQDRASSEPSSFTIIMFKPPNYKNLEYFSINPISLQSVGVYETDPVTKKLLPSFEQGYKHSTLYSTIADQEILDKTNLVLKLQLQVRTTLQEMNIIEKPASFNNSIKTVVHKAGTFAFKGLSYFVLWIQLLTLYVIKVINFEVRGTSLVTISQVFNQLDLRLKQITYFPIQFLCFYDKNILYKGNEELLKELGLPSFNSNLNINNSNYINLYNSVWLMVNDVLLGIAAWSLFKQHFGVITRFLNETVLEKILFADLFQLISWISYHHPAGFKLNNELGSFIGDLFLWSLNTWKSLIEHVISSPQTPKIAVVAVNILCHLGLTFFVGSLIDLLKLTTVHVLWFYHTSARIYQKQMDTIKSLFQLFRGKKYNVLRNRVDNLDNYSQPTQFFDVDQLLLGTLLFMILILLLPTIFTFYLTFFIIRLSNILVLNFFENILIIINFVPLFVVLLKLKNSSRLQGGVTFQVKSFAENCTYLELRNKSLTYPEIFKNFTFLFKHMKNFRTSIISYFLRGQLISLNHNQGLKFHYLMLPENLEKSIDIWKYFSGI